MKRLLIIQFIFLSLTATAACSTDEGSQQETEHIPATLPEDLNPDDITTPGRPDDAGIDMPGNATGTEAWLRRIGLIE